MSLTCFAFDVAFVVVFDVDVVVVVAYLDKRKTTLQERASALLCKCVCVCPYTFRNLPAKAPLLALTN